MESGFSLANHLASTGKHRAYLDREECLQFEKVASSRSSWSAFVRSEAPKVANESSEPIAEPNETVDSSQSDAVIDNYVTAMTRRMRFSVLRMMSEQFPFFDTASIGAGVLLIEAMDIRNKEVEKEAEADKDAENEAEAFHAAVPVDDMYYSLELDRVFIKQYDPSVIPKRKDPSDKQNNAVKKADAAANSALSRSGGAFQNSSNAAQSAVKTDPDPDNLKYLLEVISKNAKPEKEKEMKTLVQRLRRSRSKWAHDYRIGQESLYEALEKVLVDLKNYTEHSEPFLVRVSKKDVPEYYNVIKNPMDLGTMTKKLYALEYMSKESFAQDLSLIWSNCLLFNQIPPDNIYRKKAMAMRRRSGDLLKRVPDITIQIRPQEAESESDDEASNAAVPGEVTRSTAGAKTRRGSQSMGSNPSSRHASFPNTTAAGTVKLERGSTETAGRPDSPMVIDFDDDTGIAPVKAEVAVAETRARSRTVSRERTPQTDFVNQEGDSGAGLSVEASANGTPAAVREDSGSTNEEIRGDFASNAGEVNIEGSIDEEEDYEKLADLQVRKYLKVTEEVRKENYMMREHCLNTPFSDRPLLRGDPSGYTNYAESFEAYRKRNSARRHGTIESQDAAITNGYFLPELSHFGSSLPEIPVNQKWNPWTAEGGPKLESLSEYPEAHPDFKSPINTALNQNIDVLRKIKQTHNRLAAKDASDVLQVFGAVSGYRPTVKREQLQADFCLDRQSAEALMGQFTSRLLIHTGFDSVHRSAMALMNDIGIQYMTNLGRTLRLYLDKKNQTLSSEEIVQHSLQVNGVDTVNELDLYMRNDIHRYGTRLSDLKRRLALLYKSLLESGNLDPEGASDFKLGEIDAQVMSGHFVNELGVDFLNLKDLGIDVSTIPIELWNRKAEASLQIRKKSHVKQEKAETDAAFNKVDPATKWSTINPNVVIGLLKPYYEKRALANELADDEETAGSKSKIALRAKQMVKIALVGRSKKPNSGAATSGGGSGTDANKLAKQAEIAKAKEVLKKKKEAERAAERAEKAKLKEEKKLGKKKEREMKAAAAAAAVAAASSTTAVGGGSTSV
ncbi:hypothetical protein BJ741DRAFT_585434 [Chytriomyces cf. hyalinus JEL632]|nr:hypothetical protein BJ741DRAFT_585434 [Chytriomyces cf. hyalinus JEL632]